MGTKAVRSVKEFAAELARIRQQLAATIALECNAFPADAAAQAARRARAAGDLEFFARTYFPHYIKRGNSVLHEYLYRRLPELAGQAQSATDVIAAPRGEAKSTLCSRIFVLWCVCTARKHYMMIGMDAFAQAAIMLEALKAELEVNPRLALDYPEAVGVGKVWQAGVILTANNIKIEAVGSGQRIRGRIHGPHRPDLFIGDDLENDENVRTPEQRDKLEGWLKRAVMQLGGAGEKYDVIIIGTVLHYDSVLSRLLNNPLWRAARFRGILDWPVNLALWDQWEQILLTDGSEAAQRFYAARQAAMQEGARVSWPDGRPLVALMTQRARDGHAAFDSEVQNDPLSDEDAPFAAALKSPQIWWHTLPPGLVFFGACDPSLGKSGAARDPSALLVGGFDRTQGVLYVIAASVAKRLPDQIIEEIIAAQAEHRCLAWAVESVQFQEFLRTELVKRGAARGIPVPARGVTPHTDKALRIASLQPHIKNGLIRLHTSQKALIDQLRHWPKADHDDGPDALQMLWTLAVRGAQTFAYTLAARSAPRVAWQGGVSMPW